MNTFLTKAGTALAAASAVTVIATATAHADPHVPAPIAVQQVASPIEDQRAIQDFGVKLSTVVGVGGLGGTIVGGAIGCLVGGIIIPAVGCIPGVAAGAAIGALVGNGGAGLAVLAVEGPALFETFNAQPGTSKWADTTGAGH